jgi:DNA-binding MarR family transcriptional regulator
MNPEDLGALFARITKRLIAAERPILDAHELTMWQYIVLSRLSSGPAPTQLALARASGYDKTRLIGLLDDLEAAGLVTREPDPADRRAKVVRLTDAGTKCLADTRADIRAMEEDVLAELPAQQREALLAALAQLAR